ncbi:hypothetical protein ACIB24_18890 [Spongisporangium articulatum]|uniref:Uncharacterized protein n=1 Tax=Spongisporangium articulatum TaxID=3362603 RepID=A0ABW8ARW5_9ACTN
MDGTDAGTAFADYASLTALQGRVRATRRAASVPLLVVGAGLTIAEGQDFLADRVLAPSGPSEGLYDPGFFGSTPVQIVGWVVVPLAFTVLWWLRRRARRGQGMGVSRPAGAAAAGAVTFAVLPPLAIVLSIGGPFLAAAPGLLLIGLAEKVRALTVWSLTVGLLGVLEGPYWLTNRLPEADYVWWYHHAIMLTLALLTVALGVVARLREGAVRAGD